MKMNETNHKTKNNAWNSCTNKNNTEKKIQNKDAESQAAALIAGIPDKEEIVIDQFKVVEPLKKTKKKIE